MSGFYIKTAAALVRGEKVSQEDTSEFVSQAMMNFNDIEILCRMVSELEHQIANRDAEIEMLKGMLMEAEK